MSGRHTERLGEPMNDGSSGASRDRAETSAIATMATTADKRSRPRSRRQDVEPAADVVAGVEQEGGGVADGGVSEGPIREVHGRTLRGVVDHCPVSRS